MDFTLEEFSDYNRLSLGNQGFIDYRIVGKDETIVWDCYTDPKFRGQGVFKKLLSELRKRYRFAVFYSAVSNKKIIPYLLSIDYKVTEIVPLWGKMVNCINLKQEALIGEIK